MFERFVGTRRIDIDLPGTTTTELQTRHYDTGDDLRREVADARVWGGIHFRFSTETGGELGRQVADWALDHEFRPDRFCRR